MDYTITWTDPTSYTTGSTAFGTYESQQKFKTDAVKVAKYTARKLGFPAINIQITPFMVFNAFEQSINQYQTTIQQNTIQNHLIDIMGTSTSSNYNNIPIYNNVRNVIKLSQQYGDYMNIGKNTKLYSSSIKITAGQQVYDLSTMLTSSLGQVQITNILHFAPNLANMIANPFNTEMGLIDQDLVNGFGIFGLNVGMYMMMPVHQMLLKMQAIEFNQQIRRSAYSFQLIGKQLRIYPMPRVDNYLWITFKIKQQVQASNLGKQNTVSNISNMKMTKALYAEINQPGQNWIFKFTVALSKQMLGLIRSKYGDIPLPDGSVQMDGTVLRQQAKQQQALLIQQLTNMLQNSSQYVIMQKKRELSDNTHQILKKIPFKHTISVG